MSDKETFYLPGKNFESMALDLLLAIHSHQMAFTRLYIERSTTTPEVEEAVALEFSEDWKKIRGELVELVYAK